MSAALPPLLQAKDLTVEIAALPGERRIGLRRVSLSLASGEIVALAGESGGGPALLARLAAGIADPRAKVLSGALQFEGTSLLGKSRRHLLALRRGPIAVIASEASAPPDPDRTVQQWRRDLGRLAKGRLRDWDDCCFSVGLLEADLLLPRRLVDLSPLDRKRLGAVRALLLGSRLIVSEGADADLDPLAERAWLDLLSRLRDEFGIGMLVSTGTLRGVERCADRVAVFFEGGLLEEGPTDEILAAPRFAYTRELRACDPRLHGPPGGLPAIRPESLREAEAEIHRPPSPPVGGPDA